MIDDYKRVHNLKNPNIHIIEIEYYTERYK